jgi:SAM-dependent methyltransferase
MTDPNYESKWWGYIYDEMMAELPDWVDNNRAFYQDNLEGVRGAVLECACGTGIFLLPFLQAGYDIYGFDISKSMLAALQKKARAMGIENIASRISVQDFETFHYEQRFEAIIIPTNAFRMLTTQEAQLRALRTIHAHLAPGGKLLLDLILAGLRDLVESPEVVEGTWYTWTHPETGLPIRQRILGRYDFDRQLVLDHCYIEYEGQAEDFPMTSRWIYKDEFQLLLRLAGFSRWHVSGTPQGGPLVLGLEGQHSYWVAEK